MCDAENFPDGVDACVRDLSRWSRQPPLGEREAFHGPPDYVYPAGTVFHSSRAGAATACSPCAYGRTCAVPRVEVTESSFISLTLYLYTTYQHMGVGPCYLAVRVSVLSSSYGRVTWAASWSTRFVNIYFPLTNTAAQT